MEPNNPSVGGIAMQTHTTPTLTGLSSVTTKHSLCPSEKQKGKATTSSSSQPLTFFKDEGKGKATIAFGPKKRKKVTHRKVNANKQAGIKTRRRSPTWDHF